MKNGTSPQIGEEQRREIEGLYEDKRRQIARYSKLQGFSLAGAFAGLALLMGGSYAASLVRNPQGNTQVFQRYNATVITLNELEREKGRVGRVKSLDEVIGVYKKKSSAIEQSEEFRAKKEEAYSREKVALGVTAGGMGLMFLSLLGFLGYNKANETCKKQVEERKKLEESKLEESLA